VNTADQIRQLLDAAFSPEALSIIDESWQHAGHAGARESGGGHFAVEIKSFHFNNLSRMQRHRLIYNCLQPLFPAQIHALSIHAQAGEQASCRQS